MIVLPLLCQKLPMFLLLFLPLILIPHKETCLQSQVLRHCLSPQCPFSCFPWHSVKCLLQVHKDIYSFFFFSLNFSCSCLIKIASVVDFPGQKPNCRPSTFINFLNLSSNTFSNNYIPCFNSLIPLYFPYSKASPFSL